MGLVIIQPLKNALAQLGKETQTTVKNGTASWTIFLFFFHFLGSHGLFVITSI